MIKTYYLCNANKINHLKVTEHYGRQEILFSNRPKD